MPRAQVPLSAFQVGSEGVWEEKPGGVKSLIVLFLRLYDPIGLGAASLSNSSSFFQWEGLGK